ncbi:MAG: ATP-binding protein [Deinococcota bacterium]
MSDLTVPPPAGALQAQEVLNALASHVAIVDREGLVVMVNRAWQDFSVQNGGDPTTTGVGSNYLTAAAPNPVLRDGLRAVLGGKRPTFELTYPCHAPHERRWFRVRIVPLPRNGPVTHALVEHLNISREARWQEELWRTRESLNSQVADRTAKLQRQSEDLASRAGALEAFVQFTEATAATSEPKLLAQQVDRVLRATLGDVAVAYYEQRGVAWVPSHWTEGLPSEVETRLREGVPLPPRLVTEALKTGQAVFCSAGSGEADVAGLFGALALLPLALHRPGDTLLAMGSLSQPVWSRQARDVFRAVGRSLGLALGRTGQARHLAEQRAQLAELNAELTAYTASLSRDLRDPARRIAGFTDLLEKRLPKGDPAVQRHLDIIRAETSRLQTLVEDLAQLQPLQDRELQCVPLALGPMVMQVRSDLAHATRGRRIVWQVGELPHVYADPLLLRQILAHLLHNALKFTRGRDPAQIEVGGEERTGDVIIWVRDNGVGFDPAQASRLFQVFTRLHGEAYEGSGVGLANVRRLVHRQGGQVWAEGQPGRGACFFFTLPQVARRT